MWWRSDRPLRDNERALIDLLQAIETKYENILVIVEGKRDEQVLRDLGIKAPIIRTQSGKNRPELIEYILSQTNPQTQVLILTDFDPEGVELAKYIERELIHHKVHVLVKWRLEVRKRMGNWRCIEELTALFKRKDSPEPMR